MVEGTTESGGEKATGPDHSPGNVVGAVIGVRAGDHGAVVAKDVSGTGISKKRTPALAMEKEGAGSKLDADDGKIDVAATNEAERSHQQSKP